MDSPAREPRAPAPAPAPARPARHRRHRPRWQAALRHLRGRLRPFRTPWVGEVLLREQVITPAQLHKALARQREVEQPIGLTVVQMGLASEEEVLAAINKHFRIAASALTENIAALIRSRAASRRALQRLRRLLRVRLSLVVIAVTWATILALSLVVLGRQQAQLTDNAIRLGAVSLGYLAEDSRTALGEGDSATLDRLARTVAHTEGIREAIVTDADGIVRARSGGGVTGQRLQPDRAAQGTRLAGNVTYAVVNEPGAGKVLYLRKPVVAQSRVVGWAHVAISLEGISREVRHEGLLIGLLSLLIVAFGVVLAMQQGGRLLRPVSAWLASAPGNEGKEEFRVQVRANHEFEDLAASFDHISQALTQKLMVERSFGQYVNPSVLEMIRANPEEPWLKGQRNEVTVLFADVRGFTSIAEMREPEAVVEALNEYFAVATGAIVEHGGYVDKYIGDAVLGVFGVPSAHEDHALRAVRAAVTMQKQLKRRSRNNLNPFLNRIGVGVNSGVVVSGNIGSDHKMEYTVIGDCVNLASRLNGLAGPGEIVISDTVALEIPSHLMVLSTLEPQHVKGKKELIIAHKVLKTEF
jgi:adenylate cyclase